MSPHSHLKALTLFIGLAFFGCESRELSVTPIESLATQVQPPAIPLADLLEQLPMELRPKNSSDSLKIAQAEEWYAQNAVGRLVVVAVPTGRTLNFASEGNGMFSVSAEISDDVRLKKHILFGTFPLYVGAGAGTEFSVYVSGLSTSASERLRLLPADAPLEVVAKLTYVGNFSYRNVVASLDEGVFTGFEK